LAKITNVNAFTLCSTHQTVMQLENLFALFLLLPNHALTAPIATAITDSDHVQPSSVSSVPSTTLEDVGFQATNVAITAIGLPIAGVMLYLAWITFVSAHKTQEEHSDPGDDSGEQDTTGSGGGVNEDVELVEYAHITSYARSDDEADFTHRLDAQELHHDE
jgi:hypothetical protein